MFIIYILIILIELFIIYYFVCTELDRNHGYKYNICQYYKPSLGYGIFGFINTHIRLLTIFDKNQYNKHILSLDLFPEHEILVENFDEIKKEITNVYNNKIIPSFDQVSKEFSRISDNNWKTFILKWYDGNIKSNCNLCPVTCKLLKSMPNVKAAMFSILEKGKYIPRHSGPSCLCLRYHLGIDIPKGECYIIVNGEKYYWKNREGIVFDDTFEHEVYNNTNEKRIVLFIDFVRPLPGIFYKLNKMICNFAPLLSEINSINKKAEIIKDIN